MNGVSRKGEIWSERFSARRFITYYEAEATVLVQAAATLTHTLGGVSLSRNIKPDYARLVAAIASARFVPKTAAQRRRE